jgi:hypothetical protein
VEEVWKFIEDHQHSLAMMFLHSLTVLLMKIDQGAHPQ